MRHETNRRLNINEAYNQTWQKSFASALVHIYRAFQRFRDQDMIIFLTFIFFRPLAMERKTLAMFLLLLILFDFLVTVAEADPFIFGRRRRRRRRWIPPKNDQLVPEKVRRETKVNPWQRSFSPARRHEE